MLGATLDPITCSKDAFIPKLPPTGLIFCQASAVNSQENQNIRKIKKNNLMVSSFMLTYGLMIYSSIQNT